MDCIHNVKDGEVTRDRQRDKTHLLPCLNLSVSVDVRYVGGSPSRRVGDDSFSNQEWSRNRRTLPIMVHVEICVNAILGCSRPGEDYAM